MAIHSPCPESTNGVAVRTGCSRRRAGAASLLTWFLLAMLSAGCSSGSSGGDASDTGSSDAGQSTAGSSGGDSGGSGAGGDSADGGATGSGSDGSGGDGTGTGGGTDIELDTAFSDEFERDSLIEWSLRHQVEGTDAQYTVLDIDRSTPGALTIVPTRTPGWFADGDAPLIYKLVDGNFSVETRVVAESRAATQPGMSPDSNFNSGGLMARNPMGDGGAENHIMVNIGRQDSRIAGSVGSESKSTRNSVSSLTLQRGTNQGRLVLCRVGDEFRTYRWLDNETEWREIGRLTRPDLPSELQVGMVANGFNGPDLRARFDHIRLHRPSSIDECLR